MVRVMVSVRVSVRVRVRVDNMNRTMFVRRVDILSLDFSYKINVICFNYWS